MNKEQYSKQQKISYKLFHQEQRILLQSKYPFLTKSQISKKVKDQWNNLELKDKQGYTKTVLIKVSPKSVTPKTKPRKRTALDDAAQKKWKGFSTPEGLFSDFETLPSTSTTSEKAKKSRKTKCAESITKCNNWLEEIPERSFHQVTENASEHSHSKLKIPVQLSDESPEDCTSILKRNEEGTDSKPKGRVSFAPLDNNKGRDHSILPQNDMVTEFNNAPVCEANYSPGSSEEEYTANLIHRPDIELYDFEDIDKYDLCVEGSEGYEEKVCNRKEKCKISQDIDKISDCEEVANAEICKDTEQKSKKRDRSQTQKNQSTKTQTENSKVNKSKNTNEGFVSPSQAVRTRSRSKITPISPQNVLKPINKEEVAHKGEDKDIQKSLTTPVIKTMSGCGEYTTPMMDESVARYNLDEVSKAPVKRKSQGNEENLQQGASLKMHKKVRSSLRNISSDSKMENSESNIVVDASGDAKEKNKGDIQQKKKKKSFRGGRCSSSPRMDADSLIETDKACDRQNNQMSADNSRNSEQLSNTEMNTSKYMTAGKLGKQKSNRSTRMEDACLGDMYFTDDMSECSTVTERSVTVKSKINRSLATCLESMKNTVQCIHSPQYSESPALLVSPSLSGISQLSDLSANSSGCDVQKIQEESICQHKNLSDELLEIPKEVIKISEPNSKGLCDMFQNLSPPEKLGSIQSNRRIARSSVSSGNSNFATLYKDEEIFI